MISPVEPEIWGGEPSLGAAELAGGGGGVAPWGRLHEVWLDTGRAALRVALRSAAARGARAVLWLPEFCCAELHAAAAAESFAVRTYSDAPVDEGFVAPAPADGEVFLYIHYFGFRNAAVEAWLAARSGRGFLVIEDCAHGALTAGVGQVGDVVFSSLRKLLPVPDGALLGADFELACDGVEDADEGTVNRRLAGKLLRGVGQSHAAAFLRWFGEAEAALAAAAPARRSWVSTQLIDTVDQVREAQRRVANYAALAAALAERPALAGVVVPLRERLCAGEVPLGLPVRIEGIDRDALRAALALRGAFCPVHWPVSPSCGTLARALSAKILTLPIEPSRPTTAMARLADLVEGQVAQATR
jgi:hypothetical protein